MPVGAALLVFEQCDLLDLGGPYEVLLTANRLAARAGEPAPFDVRTVGLRREPVRAYGGLGLLAEHAVDEAPPAQLLVVPGLIDVAAATGDTELIDAVRMLADRSRLVASVCTGAFLLAAAGLLAGRAATTHHEDLAALAGRGDVGEVVDGRRWVTDGAVVTGAGLSSGISLGLHLVDRLVGRELALATAAQIEHDWDPEGGDQPAGTAARR